MDALDQELYGHKRLPKVRTDRGPTAEWMAYLEELHDRVAEFPQAEENPSLNSDETVTPMRTMSA